MKFGRGPCRRADRIEEFDQWNGVGFGPPLLERIRMRGGIGAERGMKIGGQEHPAAAPCNSLASPASAWRERNQSAAFLAPLAARTLALENGTASGRERGGPCVWV